MDTQNLGAHLARHWPAGADIATTAELFEADIGDRMLTRAVQRGLLLRLRRGAYIQAATWMALKPWEQSRLRLLAHILSTEGRCHYSHFSAARLHQLAVWNCGEKIHLTSTTTPSGSSAASDVCQHHLPLDAAERVQFRLKNTMRISVTSLERTVVDCARFGGFAQAVVIGDNALHTGADLAVMVGMVAKLGGARGVKKARRVLAALDGKSESAGESRTRLFLAKLHIPQPVLQYRIRVETIEYRADFAWPELKLILEFDGNFKYFDFRPTAEVLRDERRRENLLIERGWRFIRIEWADLARVTQLRDRVYAAVAAAQLAIAA